MISIVELNERVVRSFDKLRYKLFIKFPINELNWTENELATYTTTARQPTSLGTPTLGLYQPRNSIAVCPRNESTISTTRDVPSFIDVV